MRAAGVQQLFRTVDLQRAEAKVVSAPLIKMPQMNSTTRLCSLVVSVVGAVVASSLPLCV